MMSVGYIEVRHFRKLLSDRRHVLHIVDYPELMSESIHRSNEIIKRLGCSIFADEFQQHLIIRIGKKDRFDIGIVHSDMLHTVFFLIRSCKLMLF